MSKTADEMSIGFVVRTKNRSVLLVRALESIASQTHENLKVVVVNDGGDPGGVELVCGHFKTRLQGRLKILHNRESVGMEAASNMGLQLLQTDFVLIHDDDDSVSPEFAARMISIYLERQSQYPSLGGIACHCNRVLEHVEGNIVRIENQEEFNQHLPEGYVSLDLMASQNQFPPICFMLERSKGNAMGFFNEKLPVLGDWEFHLRFLLQHDIWLHPETLAFYHHRVAATGDLGNTVIAGVDKHRIYRQWLENKWLREDVQSGRTGLGALVNQVRKSPPPSRAPQTPLTHYRMRELARAILVKVYNRFFR